MTAADDRGRLKAQPNSAHHDRDHAPSQAPVSQPGHGSPPPPDLGQVLQRNATSRPAVYDHQQGVKDSLLGCHSGKAPIYF